MHEKTEMLHELCEAVTRELEDYNDKLRKAGGKMSSGDAEAIDKLSHTLKSLKTTIAMMEADDGGYSERYMPYWGGMSYNDGMSYADGRGGNRGGNRGGSSYDGTSYAQRRDSRGRYSNDGVHDRMVMELREAMNAAQDSGMREEIRRIVEKAERM